MFTLLHTSCCCCWIFWTSDFSRKATQKKKNKGRDFNAYLQLKKKEQADDEADEDETFESCFYVC